LRPQRVIAGEHGLTAGVDAPRGGEIRQSQRAPTGFLQELAGVVSEPRDLGVAGAQFAAQEARALEVLADDLAVDAAALPRRVSPRSSAGCGSPAHFAAEATPARCT